MTNNFEDYIRNGEFEPSSTTNNESDQSDYVEELLHAKLLRQGKFEANYKMLVSDRMNVIKLKDKKLPRFNGNHVINGNRIKNICVTTFGGYGDVFLFGRYFADLLEKTEKVSIIVGTNISDLFKQNMPGDIEVCDRANGVEALYRADAWVMFDTLPHITRKGYGNAAWINKHPNSQNKKPRVGVVWAGSNTASHNSIRSIPISRFKRLFEIQGIEWHSLQVGDYAHECPDGVIDHSKDIKSWTDTVSLVNTLDLVISVDTGTANLVGSMGMPLWILVDEIGEYRWGIKGEATPWFPSARVFRQQSIYDWDDVIKNVSDALKAWRDK